MSGYCMGHFACIALRYKAGCMFWMRFGQDDKKWSSRKKLPIRPFGKYEIHILDWKDRENAEMNELCRKAAAFRCGTLLYYNQILWERNLITEREYREMQRRIRQRYSHGQEAGR